MAVDGPTLATSQLAGLPDLPGLPGLPGGDLRREPPLAQSPQSPQSARSAPLAVPANYDALEQVGEGATAVVWRARERTMTGGAGVVAVKVARGPGVSSD